MLSKENRLKGQRIFAQLAKTGRRVHCGVITLLYRRISSSKPNPTQIGIVVSTKIDKRATVRNTIKRRLRVVFREALDQEIIPKDNYQFMVLVKSSIIGLSVNELKKSILPCLPRTWASQVN
jgi:ribonuclease P protein component